MAQSQTETYLKMRQLRERYSCSHMFIERRLVNDPTFPRPIYLGPHRAWKLTELEKWEAAQATRDKAQKPRAA
jgi:predicted DNA-binding transcriptional regulator AlpA